MGLLLVFWASAYGVLAAVGLVALAVVAGFVGARIIRRR
jgi:hypothetical protein